jgi:transcriptional regulator with XRE-family HTH domain
MSTKSKSYFDKLERLYGPLTFGSLLKAFREAEGLTQVEFSKRLDLSKQNVSDLENGRKIPSPTRASNIAKKLKLPEAPLIQIAIKDSLQKDGFNYDVHLESAS